MAPKIDRSALQTLQVRAGQTINFDVPVEGEPPPVITWLNPEGRELKHGGRVKLDNPDYQTKLQIRTAERSDSGRYTIRARNINGEDVAEVKVNVIGKFYLTKLSLYLLPLRIMKFKNTSFLKVFNFLIQINPLRRKGH